MQDPRIQPYLGETIYFLRDSALMQHRNSPLIIDGPQMKCVAEKYSSPRDELAAYYPGLFRSLFTAMIYGMYTNAARP